jgi:hypothetical protein
LLDVYEFLSRYLSLSLLLFPLLSLSPSLFLSLSLSPDEQVEGLDDGQVLEEGSVEEGGEGYVDSVEVVEDTTVFGRSKTEGTFGVRVVEGLASGGDLNDCKTTRFTGGERFGAGAGRAGRAGGAGGAGVGVPLPASTGIGGGVDVVV